MRKQSIVIEETMLDYALKIYSDLPVGKIERIEGVVSTWEDEQQGYVKAYVDKRYDRREIANQIKGMANG